MSSGCRVTNALDISVQFSRYTGIFVFWNALPDADSEHRLSQTVHCRSPGMTIAGFFRFVLISEFTPFLQDLCFISHDGFRLVFSLVPGSQSLPSSFPPRRCDDKIAAPKNTVAIVATVARQGFNGSSERNWSAGVFGNWRVHFGRLPFICANRWIPDGRFFWFCRNFSFPFDWVSAFKKSVFPPSFRDAKSR